MEFLQENWIAIWTLGLLMWVFGGLGYVYIQTIISGLVRRYYRDYNTENYQEMIDGINRLSEYQDILKYFSIGGIVIQLLMIIIR